MTKNLRKYCSRTFVLVFGLIHLFAGAQTKGYFQQKVDYTIHVTLDDVNHELIAKEEIIYKNNSPNSLDTIYFHLWPNAYKDNSTALGEQFRKDGPRWKHYLDSTKRGYITDLDFHVNEKKVNWQYDSVHKDICMLILNPTLKSGEQIKISTPFRVKIPRSYISRLGHWQQTYDITQWYPKPAVYDKHGWHPMPYLDMGEFYSEFGSFDVYISLPENYTVGATGDLINNEKELKRLDSIALATKAILKTQKDISKVIPKSSKQIKTLHYHQENVHDFAWFANKNFLVLKGEVELPHSKNKVTLWSMFTPYTARLWSNSIEYLHDATYYYSLWLGDYPYNHVTAIESPYSDGGGMEYPNITIIGKNYDTISLENVIMHEVGHNWFYGILGSNERDHPWMDEGMNTFYENRYVQTKYPDLTLADAYIPSILSFANFDKFEQKEFYYLAYKILAVDNNDQPMNLHSEAYDGLNYGMVIYDKSSAVFNYLMHAMGQDKFDSLMQDYYNKWKFKHPHPSDFRDIAKSDTTHNLDWFLEDVLTTNKKIDYKLSKIKRSDNNHYQIKIKNVGGVKSPISISTITNNSIDSLFWIDGFAKHKWIDIHSSQFDKLKIDAENNIPEINRQNNTIKRKGLLKKMESLRFQLGWNIDDPDYTQIYGFPVAGWNFHDGFMAGAAFYSNPLPKKQFDYLIMPLYAVKKEDISGNLNLGYTFFPNIDFIQKIRFGINSKTYGYESTSALEEEKYTNSYQKFAPEFSIQFSPISRSPQITHGIRLRNIHITKDIINFNTPDTNLLFKKDEASYYMNVLDYELKNNRAIDPFSLSARIEQNNQIVKASLTFNYKVYYRQYGKSLKFRFFGGGFLYKDDLKNISQDYRFRLSSWNGMNDYLFDYYFFGRNAWETPESTQQMVLQDGGFKTRTGIGQTWDWLSSANFDIDFPGKIPIGVYADLGVFINKETSIYNQPTMLYDIGGRLTLIKGICNIYFPAILAQDIRENVDLNTNNYMEQIRFSLYLNKLNPLKQIENVVK